MNNDYQTTGQNEPAIDPELEAAWKAERLGKFTSSSIHKLMSKPRSKGSDKFFGDTAETYIYAKVAEVLTQETNEITSAAIKWGNEHEEDAIRMFEKLHNKQVEYYGKSNPVFTEYDKHPEHSGGSLDGFIVSECAVVETKCPFASGNHAEFLHLVSTNKFDLKSFDPDYYGQIQFNMHIKKSKIAYIVSYDPRCVNYLYSVAVSVIKYDEEYINELLPRIDEAVKVKIEFLTAIGYYEKSE